MQGSYKSAFILSLIEKSCHLSTWGNQMLLVCCWTTYSTSKAKVAGNAGPHSRPFWGLRLGFKDSLLAPPPLHACLLLAALPVSTQVRNMNHPGLQTVLLGRLLAQPGWMRRDKSEMRLTAPASLHPFFRPSSPSKPSVCSLLPLQALPLNPWALFSPQDQVVKDFYCLCESN